MSFEMKVHPIGLSMGPMKTTEAPFSAANWQDKVYAGGEYVFYMCGINALWVDPYQSCTPGVPINKQSIQNLQDTVFTNVAQAKRLRNKWVVGTLASAPDVAKGSLQLLSPDEELFALIFALASKVNSADAEELAEWQEVVKSWPVTLELHENSMSFYWRSINLRESIGTNFDVFYRTPIQRAFEIINFKLAEEAKNPNSPPLSAQSVFNAWSANVNFATFAQDRKGQNSEKTFKMSFVDACLTVHNRILSHPHLREILLRAEDRVVRR